MRPQLSKGSLESAVETPESTRNRRRGSTKGCRQTLRLPIQIRTTQITVAIRKAFTAPLVDRGAHAATPARQTKRATSTQRNQSAGTIASAVSAEHSCKAAPLLII